MIYLQYPGSDHLKDDGTFRHFLSNVQDQIVVVIVEVVIVKVIVVVVAVDVVGMVLGRRETSRTGQFGNEVEEDATGQKTPKSRKVSPGFGHVQFQQQRHDGQTEAVHAQGSVP